MAKQTFILQKYKIIYYVKLLFNLYKSYLHVSHIVFYFKIKLKNLIGMLENSYRAKENSQKSNSSYPNSSHLRCFECLGHFFIEELKNQDFSF